MTSILDIAANHGNPHKSFLQLVLGRGGIRASKIVEVFQSICTASGLETVIPDICTPEVLCEALIDSINPVLERLDLSIGISTSYSVTDEKYIVMYSTSASAKSSKLSVFSDSEQTLFEAWIKEMFVENSFQTRGELDGTLALNACIADGIRPLQAEAFLNKLVKDNILKKLRDYDSYVFSPRAAMEIEPRLRVRAYDVPACPICKNLVIIRRFSHHCFICNIVMHSTCLNKMITLSTTAVACPGYIEENIRCTNKYDNETLESLVFDTPAPEVINRPVEIVGRRGGTQAPEDDEEMMENDELEAEEEIGGELMAENGEGEGGEDDANEEEDEEDEDAEEMINKNLDAIDEQKLENVQPSNNDDDDEEEEEEDEAESKEGTEKSEEDESMNEEEESTNDSLEENDNDKDQMEELEERFAGHNVEEDNGGTVETSSSSKQNKSAMKESGKSTKRKSGDALDDLFDEMDNEE